VVPSDSAASTATGETPRTPSATEEGEGRHEVHEGRDGLEGVEHGPDDRVGGLAPTHPDAQADGDDDHDERGYERGRECLHAFVPQSGSEDHGLAHDRDDDGPPAGEHERDAKQHERHGPPRRLRKHRLEGVDEKRRDGVLEPFREA
jgi:hypothetical protein